MPVNHGSVLRDEDFDDNDPGRGSIDRELNRIEALVQPGRVKHTRINRDELEAEDERQEQKLSDGDLDCFFEFVDLTDNAAEDRASSRKNPFSGRTRKLINETLLDIFTTSTGLTVQKGTTVELEAPIHRWEAEFLKIQEIAQDRCTSTVTLRGFLFTRTRHTRGMLRPKLNEVCMLTDTVVGDNRPWQRQALVEVPARVATAIRELRVTNAPFPKHRFRQTEYLVNGKRVIAETGPLVCRYRMHWRYNGIAQKENQKVCEWELKGIPEEDADPAYRIKRDILTNQWRGGKVVGGAYFPNGREPVIDLDKPETPALVPGQRYLAGDIFCGAGGASRGMERAGVRVDFAVDHWDNAAKSYDANFPDTKLYSQNIDDFIKDTGIKRYVDFMHLSPPCQVWSPAHTVQGKNDDANIATLFSCEHIISKCKPRIFTVEQTFGILNKVFELYFNMLISGFTKHGYSVRWKIMHLKEYGLPQPRRRLIMVGAGPGEKLPPFPEPTHSANAAGDGSDGSASPLVTVHDVLHNVGRYRDHPLHNPRVLLEKAQAKGKEWPPWDPHKPLPKTITCSGGQNYHWSGKRALTLMEYALLQGFPAWHKFRGAAIIKQIGNAFPPLVVRFLYEHLTHWLDEVDGVQGIRETCALPDKSEIVDVEAERAVYLDTVRKLNSLTKLEDDDLIILEMTGCIEVSDDEDGTESVQSDGTIHGQDDFVWSRESSPGFEILNGPPAIFGAASTHTRTTPGSPESRVNSPSRLINKKRKKQDEDVVGILACPPGRRQRRESSSVGITAAFVRR